MRHPYLLSGLMGVACLLLTASLAAQATPDTLVVPLLGLDVSVASRLTGRGAGQSVDILTAEDLEELPIRSIAEALTWVTGVDLQPRSSAQADLSLRGSTFEQVLVLVDGIRVSDPQTGHFDMDITVPLDQVQRIEVLRGPASAIHGPDAVGGVVNIVTRSGTPQPEVRLRLEGGSFGGVAGSLGTSGTVGGWRLSGGFEDDRADGHRPGVDHKTRLLQAGANRTLAGGHLGIRIGWAERDFGADGFYAPFPSYEETDALTLSTSWRGPVRGVDVEISSSWRRHEDDFILAREDPALYRNLHTSEQAAGQVTVRWRPSEFWMLLVGAEAGVDDLESTNLGTRSEDRAATFGELVWAGTQHVIQGGIRVDGRDGFSRTISPALSMSTRVTPKLSLRGALGWAHRTPSWTDRYYQDPVHAGREDLRPEDAWSTEVGSDLSLTSTALLRATVFRRRTENLIDWARAVEAPADARWETRNVESATFQGLEVGVEGIRAGPLLLRSSIELLKVEAADGVGFISKTALRPLTRSLRVMARYSLPLNGILSVQLRHHRRTGEEAYTLADAHAEIALASTRLFVNLTNVADARYDDITGLTAPGRAVRIGMRVRGGGEG